MTNEDIKVWRTTLGWSQREASRQLGCTLQTFQNLESGKNHITGKQSRIDRRTELACMALAAGIGLLK